MRYTRPHIYFKNGYWRVYRRDKARSKPPAMVERACEFVNRLNHTDEAYAYRAQMWAEKVRNGWYRKSDDETNS